MYLFLRKRRIAAGVLLMIAVLSAALTTYHTEAAEQRNFIKWAEFNVPYDALERSFHCDINTQGEISWIDLLAVLAASYGGNWENYKAKDLQKLMDRAQTTPITELGKDLKYYPYFREIYQAVLGEFLGTYITQEFDSTTEETVWVKQYGLKTFSPIAAGYYYEDYDDFGSSRSYGYQRRHLGHDLMGSVGTPIVAVESGTVETMGWNQYGGWRIGIRSFDSKRYYYYAHLRKDHPFHCDLYEGKTVTAGEVIGYMGRTGYSTTENVNNITTPHLHYGMELIFDESQKESDNEIWIDLYHITKLLEKHKSQVYKDEEKKEYYRKYEYIENPNYAG